MTRVLVQRSQGVTAKSLLRLAAVEEHMRDVRISWRTRPESRWLPAVETSKLPVLTHAWSEFPIGRCTGLRQRASWDMYTISL
jgi:hypothetical protein